jgi:hypothetical protein
MHWLVLVIALFWLAPLTLALIGGIGCAVSPGLRIKLMRELFGDPARPPSEQMASEQMASNRNANRG